MIITATFKEIKNTIPSLNYAEDEEVTFIIGEDTDIWHNDDEDEDEEESTETIDSHPNIGTLERGFVSQFANIQDLYDIAEDCLQVASQHDWEMDPRTGYFFDISRLNRTALGKAIREYSSVDGVPNWKKVNEIMTKFLEANINYAD